MGVAQERVAEAFRLTAAGADKPAYDAELARSVGADENGMKSCVLVVLKTYLTRSTH